MLRFLKVGAILVFLGCADVGCAIVDREVPLVYEAEGEASPLGQGKVSVTE